MCPLKQSEEALLDRDKIKQYKLELLEILQKKEELLKYNKIKSVFPDEGPYKRELYLKHIAFINAGAKFKQRAFIGGNRTGKTFTGGYEVALHATGLYPDWWKGKKFSGPVKIWCSGKTTTQVRDVQQEVLLGPIHDLGSGMIPKNKILNTTKKSSVADCFETVQVQHVSGGISEITFKSYDQTREQFQGTYRHVIWLDEEPRDYGIYDECLMRTDNKTNPGILICTFTPLFGLSKLVLQFLPGGKFPQDGINGYRYAQRISWDDAPHMTEEQKEEYLQSISKHQIKARSEGYPVLGSGAVYPYSEALITCKPFPIPDYWPRVYGMDIGVKQTAVVWLAMDPNTKKIYVYDEYIGEECLPAVNASAVKTRGIWIMGVIDPASQGRSQDTHKQMLQVYTDEGLHLRPAKNPVDPGILRVSQMFETQTLTIFTSCTKTIGDILNYHRDEHGRIAQKQDDHTCDALRYAAVSGTHYLQCNPEDERDVFETFSKKKRDSITGY